MRTDSLLQLQSTPNLLKYKMRIFPNSLSEWEVVLRIGIFLKIKDCEWGVVRHSGKYRNSYPKFTYWK